MMHPVHAAALEITRERFADLAAVLDGVTDADLDWKPAPGANSLAILLRHSLTSVTFWLACASGPLPSRQDYRAHERAPAFAARGATVTALHGELQAALARVETMLHNADPAALDRDTEWPEEDPGIIWTGPRLVLHALSHMAEHVGQAQLMRDLLQVRASRA